MKRIRMHHHLLILLPLALLLIGCVAPPAYTQNTLWGIMVERNRLGLRGLEWNDDLARIAQARACDLATGRAAFVPGHPGWDVYWHYLPWDAYIAEIVGRQPLLVLPDSIWIGFRNSSIHYHVLIENYYSRYIGIGGCIGLDGRVYEVVWFTNVRPTGSP
jgi:hypothetical protein